MSPVYVTLYLFFNVMYNILIIMILKYGSSNILWLAMTIMVPMVNFAFVLPFIPSPQPLTVYNEIGLVIIMLGLVVYRFWLLISAFIKKRFLHRRTNSVNDTDS
jgi:hypothetical protein